MKSKKQKRNDRNKALLVGGVTVAVVILIALAILLIPRSGALFGKAAFQDSFMQENLVTYWSFDGTAQGLNLIIDGDMEQSDVDSWASGNDAYLNKISEEGYNNKVLKITKQTTPNPYVIQQVCAENEPNCLLITGNKYVLTGRVKRDDSAIPEVYITTLSAFDWKGKDIDDWQYFRIEFEADGNKIIKLGATTNNEGSFVQYDDISLTLLEGENDYFRNLVYYGAEKTPGYLGNSIYLDGSSYVRFPRIEETGENDAEFTVTAWVKPENEAGILAGATYSSWNRFDVSLNALGHMTHLNDYLDGCYRVYDFKHVYSQPGLFDDGLWHHIAITYDVINSNSDLYVDGAKKGGIEDRTEFDRKLVYQTLSCTSNEKCATRFHCDLESGKNICVKDVVIGKSCLSGSNCVNNICDGVDCVLTQGACVTTSDCPTSHGEECNVAEPLECVNNKCQAITATNKDTIPIGTISRIGALGTYANREGMFFKGYIDEFSVWDKVLTDADILSIYNNNLNELGLLEVEFVSEDSDGDGFDDSVDNCIDIVNPNQADYDEDGEGDACDPDFVSECVNYFDCGYGTREVCINGICKDMQECSSEDCSNLPNHDCLEITPEVNFCIDTNYWCDYNSPDNPINDNCNTLGYTCNVYDFCTPFCESDNDCSSGEICSGGECYAITDISILEIPYDNEISYELIDGSLHLTNLNVELSVDSMIDLRLEFMSCQDLQCNSPVEGEDIIVEEYIIEDGIAIISASYEAPGLLISEGVGTDVVDYYLNLDVYPYDTIPDNNEITVPLSYQPPFVDTDEDGIDDSVDNCLDIANPDQANLDEDSSGDACDEDIDGDTVINSEDMYPYCDDWNDNDGDGVADACDNCIFTPNPNQENADGDEFGDDCDPDLRECTINTDCPDDEICNFEIEECSLLGDVDGDESITATDVLVALQSYVNTEEINPYLVDADCNGAFDTTDILLMLRKSVGRVDPEFGCSP
jgi:hypothetical protein